MKLKIYLLASQPLVTRCRALQIRVGKNLPILFYKTAIPKKIFHYTNMIFLSFIPLTHAKKSIAVKSCLTLVNKDTTVPVVSEYANQQIRDDYRLQHGLSSASYSKGSISSLMLLKALINATHYTLQFSFHLGL